MKCDGEWTKTLNDLWEQGLLLDAAIRTDKQRTVRAHAAVLAAHSPYIRGLLTSGLAESAGEEDHQGEISLLDVDHNAMAAIVACMYSGEIALTPANATPVIKAANMLQITAIEKAACSYLVVRMQPETAIKALAFAEQLAACGSQGEELHRQCLEYVHANFAECAASEDFLGVEAGALGQLIGADALLADPDEGVVLQALHRWFDYAPQERAASLEALLPLVRFPLLPSAAQFALKDDALLALVPSSLSLSLMTECFPGFAQSVDAAGCLRLKRRACKGQEFAFESVEYRSERRGARGVGRFDKKGVLYHIATEGGTSEWVNPHTAGRVTVSASSAVATSSNAVDRVVNGPDSDSVCFATHNISSSWFQLDLGASRTLAVKHYALRGHSGGHCLPRFWDLQGATSSDGPWATLRRHDNDTALEAHKERAVAAWAVEGSDVGYRFVRIRQHGANSSGSFYLCCAGIELYGKLTEASS